MTQGLTYYVGFDTAELAPTISFVEGASAPANANPAGLYYLGGLVDGAGYASWAAAIQGEMNANSPNALTYTVTWRHDLLAFQITRTSGGIVTVTLTLNTAAQRLLGMASGVTIPVTPSVRQSTARPYYVIRPALSAISNFSRDYEPDGVAFDDECDDGSSVGIARTAAPLYSDWQQLFETRAATFLIWATAAVPYTWQQLFADVRTVHPIVVVRADDADPTLTYDATDVSARIKLRAEGASFRPAASAGDDYDAYYHIPIRARIVARLASW